jgi:hypothetical protein
VDAVRQARIAGRSVLANIHGLEAQGLTHAASSRAVRLALRLSRTRDDTGWTELAEVVEAARELRGLLVDVQALTAANAVRWLDDLEHLA